LGASAQDFYILCRGPLTYHTGLSHPTYDQTSILMIRGSKAAGPDGRYLKLRTCAKPDAVLPATERINIFFKETRRVGNADADVRALQTAVPAFISCNHDTRCVFRFLVHDGLHSYETSNDGISVFFPRFQP